MNELRRRLSSAQLAVSVAILAALAYLPGLTAAPGRMPADSKLYIYLNPAQFLADTTTTFDPRLYAGWVPHQHIAYLWPMGPWFWFFETLGVPDWIAHRLWLGTLLLAAGLGVRWVARLLGLGPTAALAAALVYQLSPYLLAYLSRTSILLLPYAGLGWIVGMTMLAAERGRWRYPAGIALGVLTVGAVNATALAMIIPAPVLWLVHATWNRSITWRRAVATGAKVALLSTVVSLWWMAMLVVQRRHGADVLSFSESLESVSFTSTSTEVARGLGYWLFYIRDVFGATTTASLHYMGSVMVMALGVCLLTCALAGLVFTTWAHRRFAALLIGVGVVAAVGVHPIDDPSPVMSVLLGDGTGGLALALRSSTRAVPVLLLGLALSAAALVAAAGTIPLHRPRWRWLRTWDLGIVTALIVGLAAVGYLPALGDGGFVDPHIARDQDAPDAWYEAAAALDAQPDGYRVLQVPGAEFGAFRWGYTSDQPLPALTERPVVTRDLLPLGSAAAMDLLLALDDRIQDGVLDVESVAPVARLLGADTVWVTDDIDFGRYQLARPEIVDDLLTSDGAADAGLGPVRRFGEPVPNVGPIAVIDERSVSDPRIGRPLPTATLVGVDDPVATIRAKERTVVLSGSGDGIVDAAAAGVLDGTELVRYAASSSGGELAAAIETATRLVVTDANRDRARHWRSSQDTTGYTEAGDDPGVLRYASSDQRLAVFAPAGVDPASPTQTVSIQRGPVTATASAYGEPFAYLPEHRAVMAIDGDPATSWTVGDRADPIGEYLVLDVADPIDHVTLRQPDAPDGQRRITEIELTVDDRAPLTVALDAASLTGDGQRIDIDPTTGAGRVTITITATGTGAGEAPIGPALAAVGFATVDVGLAPTTEVIRVPVDATDALAAGDAATPVTYVFTRLRTDPTDRWRSDPEPALRRQFDVPRDGAFDVAITVRFDQRASGELLAEVLGEPVVATAHLTGVPSARAAAAFDGDAATAWITPFGAPAGQAIHVALDGTATTLGVTQPTGDFSPITTLRVTDPAGSFEVPAAASIELPRAIDLAATTIEIVGVDARPNLDRRFAEPVTLPAAISEITFDGRSPDVSSAETIEADCRGDLLALDGQAVLVSFTATIDDITSGAAIDARLCGDETGRTIGAGTHRLASAVGASTGWHVDRFTLSQIATAEAPAAAPAVTVTGVSRTGRTVEVAPCPTGCWVVLGEGHNPAWTASADGRSLGPPTLVDGNANGWWLAPSDEPTVVTMRWTAQGTLNAAFAASAAGIAACIALVVADRRHRGDARTAAPLPRPVPPWRWGDEPLSLATIGVTTVAAALFIGWRWGLVALIIGGVVWCTRRARLLALVGSSIVIAAQCVVVAVVRSERPYPNAGFPARFDWLHPWTLLGVVLLACAAAFARRGSQAGEQPPAEVALDVHTDTDIGTGVDDRP